MAVAEPFIAPLAPPLYSSPQRLIEGNLPPTMGPRVAQWIERFLVHGEGDQAGQPVRLVPHQRLILSRLFEYDPATGRLLHDRALILMGKGNAKTELVAMVALAELAGPIAPLRSPHVVTSAGSYKQANNVFRAARDCLTGGPLAEYFEVFDSSLRPAGDPEFVGYLERIAARAGTADGALPTCFIADELHEWSAAQEDMYDRQLRGLMKRAETPRREGLSGSLLIAISTQGDDPDSLLGRLYEHGKRVARGEVEDPSFLILDWEAPKIPGEDLDDPEQLDRAILAANPAVGFFLSIEGIRSAYRSGTDRTKWERLNANRLVSSPFAWVTREAWDACAARRGQPPADTQIVIGFKGSPDRNALGLVGWTLPDQGEWSDYGFVIASWEPEGKSAGWTVPRTEVDAALFKALSTWKVREVAVNPIGWMREVEDWEKQFGTRAIEKKNHREFTRGSGILFRFEGTNMAMGPACDRFKGAVLGVSEGVPTAKLTHDGSHELARHISNAHRLETRYGARIVQESGKEVPRKIDIAEAAVIARQRAMNQPQPRKPTVAASF